MNDKQEILETVQKMNDDAKFEEILFVLYTQYQVKKGLKDIEEGNVKTTEEVRAIMDKW